MHEDFVSIIKNIMTKDKQSKKDKPLHERIAESDKRWKKKLHLDTPFMKKVGKAATRQYDVPFPKLKPKQWIAFAVALLYNTTMTDTYGWPDGGFLGTLLGIICAFGVVLGEPVFKLVTPQEHYIKRAKLNLIITEWFVSVFIGVGLYAALVFLLF